MITNLKNKNIIINLTISWAPNCWKRSVLAEKWPSHSSHEFNYKQLQWKLVPDTKRSSMLQRTSVEPVVIMQNHIVTNTHKNRAPPSRAFVNHGSIALIIQLVENRRYQRWYEFTHGYHCVTIIWHLWHIYADEKSLPWISLFRYCYINL
jgi:hypothetical protein